MIKCEDCKFMRLADFMNDRDKVVYATCKASATESPVSRIFDNDEKHCDTVRMGDNYEDCVKFEALEREES